MGLLDDAIREHLDLKRRRGADPAEVERAEQEALGPVRRGPVSADPPELVLDAEHQPQWEDEFTDEHEVPGSVEEDASGSYAEPGSAQDPRSGVTRGLFDDEDPFGDQGPGAEPPASRADRASAEPDPFDESAPAPHRALPRDQRGETVEYNVGEAFGEDGKGADDAARPPAQKSREGTEEDPLEETPEFLQETPDHDRLWFEQRPPREFDFDG